MKTAIVTSVILSSLALTTQIYAKENNSEDIAQGRAVEACADLTNKSVNSLGVSAQYQGLSLQQWRTLVGSMCLNGITAARDAKSERSLDDYWYGMKQNYFDANAGVLSSPLDPAWAISKKYFRTIHGINEIEEAPYPSLGDNPTTEQKVEAIEKYSNQKTIRGMPIKRHCELISDGMLDGTTPPLELRAVAIKICEGVMTNNLTKGKHGISGASAMKITGESYDKNSNEYRYLDHVTNLAFSESQ